MKRAFSILELIIVIAIISLIISFFVVKSSDSISFTNSTKIKADIALIRDSISKKNAKNILLDEENSFLLDDVEINKKGTALFTNILKVPFFSTTKEEKIIASWIKISKSNYMVYLNSDEYLVFSYEDNKFKCKSEINLCKEYE